MMDHLARLYFFQKCHKNNSYQLCHENWGQNFLSDSLASAAWLLACTAHMIWKRLEKHSVK